MEDRGPTDGGPKWSGELGEEHQSTRVKSFNPEQQRLSRRATLRKPKPSKMKGRGSIRPKRETDESFEKPIILKEFDTSILKKYWVTADVHRGNDATYIIFAMRDCIIHVLFVVLLLLIVYGPMGYAQNYYASIMNDLLTKTKFEGNFGNARFLDTFRTMRATPQILDYLAGVFVPFLSSRPAQQKLTPHNVLLESTLVGAPAVRMIRVRNDTCETAYLFKDLFRTCYGPFTPENEDTTEFEGASDAPSPLKYIRPAGESLNAPFEGTFGTYPDTGYQFNFAPDIYYSSLWLKHTMFAWLSLGIRFITIDFTLYTQNTDLFCAAKLAIEISPSGVLRTHSNFYTMKLLRYSTPEEYFVAACEFTFILFTIFFTLEELQQIVILGRAYFANWWNYFDIIVNVSSYATIILMIYRFHVINTTLKDKLQKITTGQHASFEHLVYIQQLSTSALAMTFFFAWVKIFKFYALDRSVQLILHVFAEVWHELAAALLFCSSITIGFALMGLVLFGDIAQEFTTLNQAVFTVSAMYIGRVAFFKDVYRAYPVIGPVYVSAYILLIFIVYFQVFIALLILGFNKIIVFMDEQPGRLYLGDLLTNSFIHLMSVFRQPNLVMSIKARALKRQDERDYDDFIRILQRHGLPMNECHLLMAVHNMKRGEGLSRQRLSEIYDELWIRNQLIIEVEGHTSIMENISRLERLIEACDHAIVDVLAKTEILSSHHPSKTSNIGGGSPRR